MTILFVDDEPLVIQDILAHIDAVSLGIDNILTAHSAGAAKKLFENEHIDIIICDIKMPGVSGIELLTWAKEHYPGTASVIITSWSAFEYARDALRLGCIDYLLKPIITTELEGVIKRGIKELSITNDEYEDTVLSTAVRRAKMYIEDSPTYEFIDRTDVASHVFLNPDYLDRCFKAELGVSITQYITQNKIQISKQLLSNSDKSIGEIASMIGYSNLSNFSFMFKQITGESPRAYRKNAMGRNGS